MFSVKKTALCLAMALNSPFIFAQSFTWTSAGDILTFDIHAQNEGLNQNANESVYEGLVRFNDDMKVEPCLATSWKRVPEGFLFEIRKNVRFHEGQTLTADDVVFSINRALLPTSQFRANASGILGAEKKGEYEVLVKTTSGSPVLLNQMTSLLIMNKNWAAAHNALKPQDYIQKEEAYAATHANGTGPFKLKSREVDIKTVFVKNPDWWDEKNRTGNLTEVTYVPIKSSATRTAALLSHEVQFVLDPAMQDVKSLQSNKDIKVIQGPEVRVLNVSLDQFRDASPYVFDKNGKPLTKNPFKDVRVRQAMALAVNRAGIVRGVMRGFATPTGTIAPRMVAGYNPEAGKVPEYNIEKAKVLLKEAGYPDGFAFTLDTPNNRWINDESICKALASMWARIGLAVTVNAMPRAQYFPKVLSFDTSAGLVGWGNSTFDGLYNLQCLTATFDKTGNGISNIGRVSSAEIDDLIRQIKTEEDADKRVSLMQKAYAIERTDMLHIPLHEQVITWAMSSNVEVTMRPNNRLTLRSVIVK